MSVGARSGVIRATVCCSRLVLPVRGSSCLGVRRRESGQRRVPEPPAITTAYTWANLLDPVGASRLGPSHVRSLCPLLRVDHPFLRRDGFLLASQLARGRGLVRRRPGV